MLNQIALMFTNIRKCICSRHFLSKCHLLATTRSPFSCICFPLTTCSLICAFHCSHMLTMRSLRRTAVRVDVQKRMSIRTLRSSPRLTLARTPTRIQHGHATLVRRLLIPEAMAFRLRHLYSHFSRWRTRDPPADIQNSPSHL